MLLSESPCNGAMRQGEVVPTTVREYVPDVSYYPDGPAPISPSLPPRATDNWELPSPSAILRCHGPGVHRSSEPAGFALRVDSVVFY